MKVTFAATLIASTMFAGCGGGSENSPAPPDDDASNNGGNNSTVAATNVVRYDDFSEDITLNENLSGIWVAELKGSDSDSFEEIVTVVYVFDDESGVPDIHACGGVEGIAEDVSLSASNVSFNMLYDSVTLTRDSMTSMSGSYVEIDAEGSPMAGTTRWKKIAAGPDSPDDLLFDRVSIGSLNFSYQKGSTNVAGTKQITCFNQEYYTTKPGSSGETDSAVSNFRLGLWDGTFYFPQDQISHYQQIYFGHPDYEDLGNQFDFRSTEAAATLSGAQPLVISASANDDQGAFVNFDIQIDFALQIESP